jgi:hypothetical protein
VQGETAAAAVCLTPTGRREVVAASGTIAS